MTTTTHPLRVALIGATGIGRAHARGWHALGAVPEFRDVSLAVACSRSITEADGALLAARRVTADWRAAVTDDEVDIVDVCLPDDLHHPVVSAALAAGKHVVCEKPLGRDAAESDDLVAQAAEAGVAASVCFVYRHLPNVAFAAELVRSGRLGRVHEVNGHYLQSWMLGTEEGSTWRHSLRRGTGVLGDLGAHLVDLARFVVPELAETERIGAVGARTLDRRAAWTSGHPGGVVGSFHVSRTAPGHVNDLALEVWGDRGGLRVTAERPWELRLTEPGALASGGVVRLGDMTTGQWLRDWWPQGAVVGWDAGFAHQFSDLVEAVRFGLPAATGRSAGFAEAAEIDRALQAIVAATGDRPRRNP